ncbi:UNVERIFIED_CONTAM: hypothetical protein NCL1_48769 [Trichonephila clavipes]
MGAHMEAQESSKEPEFLYATKRIFFLMARRIINVFLWPDFIFNRVKSGKEVKKHIATVKAQARSVRFIIFYSFFFEVITSYGAFCWRVNLNECHAQGCKAHLAFFVFSWKSCSHKIVRDIHTPKKKRRDVSPPLPLQNNMKRGSLSPPLPPLSTKMNAGFF